MKLDHIGLSNLKPSTLNVRKHRSGESDEHADKELVASIRAHGVLQPLLVRPNCEGFDIIAGQRRYTACEALAAEGQPVEALPCAIMEDGDDANAIEASLAENIARLPMDELDQYHAFAALTAQGRSVDDIAAAFGVSEQLVRQRLAIANLYSPILNACRRGEIAPGTLRILTMATTRQQKAWWKLFKSEDSYAPTGRTLKDWLFGGQHISVEHAHFDLSAYTGTITCDLFSEARYFADSGQFWQLQHQAMADLADGYRADGWAEVTIHEAGKHWPSWNYRHTPKGEGGAVHITCTADGEVQLHEGYLHESELRRREKQQSADTAKTASKPELTKAMQNYLALHRHNAVRVELLQRPNIALRLLLAHVMAGSSLWQVKPEPQRAENAAIDASVAESQPQKQFNGEAAAIRALLGIEDDHGVVDQLPHWCSDRDLADIFVRLLAMDDEVVLRTLTFVMAETLQVGSGMIEALGTLLEVDMRKHWTPDETFWSLLRDKPAINAMVTELAGADVADANRAATAKVQKSILNDCLTGARAPKAESWQPRYMDFPMRAYTERGGIAAMDAHDAIACHFENQ
jgi:ParB family chromosome partitioning protein